LSPPGRPWLSPLGDAQRSSALAAALDVAERVTEPERVRAAMAAVASRTHYPRTARWTAHDVAQGDAGLALLCGELDRIRPDEGWDIRAHQLLQTATAGLADQPLPAALCGGLAGLGFVADQVSHDGTRYRRLAAAIDDALVPQAHALAGHVRGHRGDLSVGHFDAISGLAGVAAYLLARRDRAAVDGTVEAVLRALADLALTAADPVPGWYTPPARLTDDAARARFPDGNLNCGLAHGLPGPLAVLALAASDAPAVPRWRDAVAGAAGWLAAQRSDDDWGPNWPVAVPPGTASARCETSRAAWCYGSPGVARALWLAGTALEDEALTGLAVEAMAAVYRRPVRVRHIDSPAFCHGVAGLLQITLRFGHDSGLPLFADAAVALTGQLLDAYEPDSLLGFRGVEPDGTRVDQAGLLDGAAGVALVLLAAATGAEPGWDRMFLLA
jgi:class I lanthipeptide synthase